MSKNIIEIRANLLSEDIDVYSLPYEKEVLEIRNNLYKDLKLKLEPVKVDGKYLYFELPPTATFYIGRGPNFKNFTFDEIEIKKSDQNVVLTWKNQDLLKTGKSFPNRHYTWYDID